MSKKAFTLIEVIVVVFILAVLAVLLFPVLVSARQAPTKIVAINRLRQVAIAIQQYRTDNNDEMPATLNCLKTYSKSMASEMFTCPRSGMEFHYPFNYYMIGQAGKMKDIAPEFNPSSDSVIKANHFHNFDCGSGNYRCKLATFTGKGGTFSYTIPLSEKYQVLAASLDGHVSFVPVTEAWEEAHILEGPFDGSGDK